ncbi:hypothetical protein PUR71_10930 [Streptomyces sp. SP17BM10]|uniref:hypothetical protein n=1 Tax=Streptomyces sp. SP17BM10 TaxID=3002530 RepID=UPI002E7793BE|nr:hypothetical protein [Streptomyces sp. SP17BM10]MEE1783425.1 hypothetical protein [Streptomyces sp. SP17BM10]
MDSSVTSRYVTESANPDGGLRTLTTRAEIPAVYGTSYGHLLLPRPVFVSEQEIGAFADDLAAIFRVLVSLPGRCFGGDLHRYGAAIGLPPELIEVMTEGATGDPLLYARADAFHDGARFRLLELNVGSELGGVDIAQLNRAFLDVPAFRAFAEANGLDHTDTMAHLVAGLRGAAGGVADADPVHPVVALIEGPGALGDHDGVFLSIQEDMRGHGIELLLGEIQELAEGADGKLALHGRPVDVVLRYFAAGQIAGDPVARAALTRLNRAHAAGRTALFTPLEGALFTSKAALGLLHRPEVRATLTEAEQDLVDRVLPHTWVLSGESGGGDSDSDSSGDTGDASYAEALAHARAHRTSLVLKPGIGYSADGVVIGRDVTEEQWQEALERTAVRDYVAQELVVPALEQVVDPQSGRTEGWVANWGVFVTPQGYGGAFCRALRPQDGAVITYANPGTRGTCVFTHPAARPEESRI